jgi:lambda family phage minor tail protein L
MAKAESNLNKQLVSLTPDALIDLYEIDFSSLQPNFEELKDLYGINVGAESVYRFCPMINGTNPVIWQGNSYQPLPVKMEEFEQKGDGRLPRPKFTIANPEGIFSKIIHSNQDFANCKITRKRTYARFLDSENFQQGQNPFGESDSNSHLPDDVYFVNKKTQENKNAIQFELVSALELEETFVPARVVLSGYCNFTYRCSIGCGYKGLPIETSDSKDLTHGFAAKQKSFDLSSQSVDVGRVEVAKFGSVNGVPEWSRYGHEYTNGRWEKGNESGNLGYNLGDIVKIIPRNANNPYKATPHVFVCVQAHADASKHHPFFSKDYWLKDECQKTIEACKKRFTDRSLKEYNGVNSSNPGLRFGGFPGTEKFPIE